MVQENKIPCSVEILTRNSEATLGRCLESVKDFAEIIVLDGNSTDGTLDIARRYGAKIYKQYETDEPNVRIRDFSEVRNKGLRLAQYDWFMFIDSDEYLSLELAEEIREIVFSPAPMALAWWVPRLYVLDGAIIRCATTYPNRQIRLFRKDAVSGFKRAVHEGIKTKEGVAMGVLNNIEYVPLESIAALKAKWAQYLESEKLLYANSSRRKLIRTILKQGRLFFLYGARYARNIFFCRGPRVPFRYELARHSYILRLQGVLIKLFFKSS